MRGYPVFYYGETREFLFSEESSTVVESGKSRYGVLLIFRGIALTLGGFACCSTSAASSTRALSSGLPKKLSDNAHIPLIICDAYVSCKFATLFARNGPCPCDKSVNPRKDTFPKHSRYFVFAVWSVGVFSNLAVEAQYSETCFGSRKRLSFASGFANFGQLLKSSFMNFIIASSLTIKGYGP